MKKIQAIALALAAAGAVSCNKTDEKDANAKSEEEIAVIEPICRIAERFAPDFDIEQIYAELNK